MYAPCRIGDRGCAGLVGFPRVGVGGQDVGRRVEWRLDSCHACGSGDGQDGGSCNTNPLRQPDYLIIVDESGDAVSGGGGVIGLTPEAGNQLSGNLSRSVSAIWVICAAASSMTRSRSTPVPR